MDDGSLAKLARRWKLRFGRPTTGPLTEGAVVKLVGRVCPDEAPRVSPLGGRESVIYAVEGRRMERSGRDRRVVRIADEEWSCPFWLDSDAGRVRVQPEGWVHLLTKKREIRASTQARANLDAFAARYGIHERAFFEGFGGGAVYTERCLEVGDEAAVIGEVHAVGVATSGGYRGSQTLYALRPPRSGRLWVKPVGRPTGR